MVDNLDVGFEELGGELGFPGRLPLQEALGVHDVLVQLLDVVDFLE